MTKRFESLFYMLPRISVFNNLVLLFFHFFCGNCCTVMKSNFLASLTLVNRPVIMLIISQTEHNRFDYFPITKLLWRNWSSGGIWIAEVFGHLWFSCFFSVRYVEAKLICCLSSEVVECWLLGLFWQNSLTHFRWDFCRGVWVWFERRC